jgi:sigma54-dependent transcription regulator
VSIAPLDSTAVNALLRRADKGDREAIAALRAQCEIEPARWRNFGDLAQQVRGHLLDTIARKNEFVAEAVAKEAGRLRRAWAGDDATPLEQALAERIAAAWLYLHYCEMTYLALLGEGVTWERDEFHRKRIDQAERRYLRAIKALAEVRRLRLPAVQVNIGEKQINLAG